MKSRFLTLFASALILSACTYEPLEETPLSPSETNRNETRASSFEKSHPFIIEGRGAFEMVTPLECQTPGQIEMAGEVKDEKLGRLKLKFRNCTDLREKNKLKGIFSDVNAQKMFFYSDESGKDDIGHWYVFRFYGGTGNYNDIAGEVRVYIEKNFETSDTGKFIVKAKGELNY